MDLSDLSASQREIPVAIPVQINTGDTKHALKTNPEFFIQFFLGDELTFPVPRFHIMVFNKMISDDIQQFACAIPRDHAKTTLAKLACVWYFLFTDFRFIAYLSNTSTISQQACVDIITFMESDNFRAIFGHLEWHIRREGDGLYVFTLNEKKHVLRAMGAGQQVRGINIDNQRPQLAIVDDLEDNDNIATETLYLKLKKWFYGPFKKCLDKFDNKIIQLGNMINNRCLLKDHCDSPFWDSIRFGCVLSDGTSLWPDAWSLAKLRKDFQEYAAIGMIDIWFAEMMNLPMAAGSGLIRADQIYYRPEIMPGNHTRAFITIDLAISDATWAHKTVVAVHAFEIDRWQAVEYEGRTGVDPIDLFDIVRDLALKWNVVHIGIESVAYQASLQYVFRFLANSQNLTHLEFHPLSTTVRKIQRLAGWASMIRAEEYALNEGDYPLTVELLEFNPTKKDNEDDHIDAYAYAPEMIELAAYDLILNANAIELNVQGSFEICGV